MTSSATVFLRCRLEALGEQTLGREPEWRIERRVVPSQNQHGNMKPRQNQFAAGTNAGSSRQHELHPPVGSLPLQSSTVSRKSHEDEPPPQSTAAAAEKLESFCAEPANAATDGERKSGAEDFSVPRENGEQDLASGPAAAEECLVNVSEAARFLAVSVSTLYGWVWQRRIPFVKAGRALRFEMSDLRRFVEENRIPAKAARKL